MDTAREGHRLPLFVFVGRVTSSHEVYTTWHLSGSAYVSVVGETK